MSTLNENESFEIRDVLDKTLMTVFYSIAGASYQDLYNQLYGQHSRGNFLYPLLDTVLEDLEKQGYITVNKRMSEDITLLEYGPYYFITYKGVIFCRKPILYYKNKPFTYAIFLERLNITWKIIKVIAVAAISVATLLISYVSLTTK